ncbi:hypothetical protein E3O42_12665 [Cryobacterium adonitolivorans]|uniref:Uncharacterized protein n=1 Tax=Cryobacterium adonitolivorans TaxID=1259189 RepID=A0A4R8W185_9MICO|nr:hypothetical protein E3O42_12665 [Cryobacterium adonitolivorans]
MTMIIAVRGIGMAPDGWQVRVTAWLNHAAVVIQQSVGFIPGWLSALVVFAGLATLVWKALRARRTQAGQIVSATEPDTAEQVAAGSTTPACHDNAKESK